MDKFFQLVIDRIGTITDGKPSVTAIGVGGVWDVSELLRLAAGVERASEHPLGQAIVAAAEARKLALPEVSSFDSPTGKGAVGTVEGKRIVLGNAAFLKEGGIATDMLSEQADALRREDRKSTRLNSSH